jgi:hypothetical protein
MLCRSGCAGQGTRLQQLLEMQDVFLVTERPLGAKIKPRRWHRALAPDVHAAMRTRFGGHHPRQEQPPAVHL